MGIRLNARGEPTLHLRQEFVSKGAVVLLALAGLEVDAQLVVPAQLVEGLLGLGLLPLLLLLGGALLAAPFAAAGSAAAITALVLVRRARAAAAAAAVVRLLARPLLSPLWGARGRKEKRRCAPPAW